MKKTITIIIDDQEFSAPARKFKSKKIGYGVYDNVVIDGEEYRVTCNIIKTDKVIKTKTKKVKFEKFLNLK